MLYWAKQRVHWGGVLHRSQWVPGHPTDKSSEAVRLPTTHSYNPWWQRHKCMFNRNIFGLLTSSDMQNCNFVLLLYFQTTTWHYDFKTLVPGKFKWMNIHSFLCGFVTSCAYPKSGWIFLHSVWGKRLRLYYNCCSTITTDFAKLSLVEYPHNGAQQTLFWNCLIGHGKTLGTCLAQLKQQGVYDLTVSKHEAVSHCLTHNIVTLYDMLHIGNLLHNWFTQRHH